MSYAAVPALGVFMGLVMVSALYGLTASGHFPAGSRSAKLDTNSGRIVLWGTLAITIALAFTALALAWLKVPIAGAIIGGGAMLLFAPLVLRIFPDSFVDEPIALLTFAGLGLALALLAAPLCMRLGQ
jgi:hypothetical protein